MVSEVIVWGLLPLRVKKTRLFIATSVCSILSSGLLLPILALLAFLSLYLPIFSCISASHISPSLIHSLSLQDILRIQATVRTYKLLLVGL